MRSRIAFGRAPDWVDLSVVTEVGREPSFGSGNGPALAFGVVLYLIPRYLVDCKIPSFWIRKIKAADGRCGPHRIAFGKRDACSTLDI